MSGGLATQQINKSASGTHFSGFAGSAGGVFFPLVGDSAATATSASAAFIASASDACCCSSCSRLKNSLQQ